MSLYERVELSSRAGDSLEYRLLFAVCFALLLVPTVLRRLGFWLTGARTGAVRSILREARANAANCAAASFVGM